MTKVLRQCFTRIRDHLLVFMDLPKFLHIGMTFKYKLHLLRLLLLLLLLLLPSDLWRLTESVQSILLL